MNGPSLNASLPLVFLFPWAIPPRCQALSPSTQISVPLTWLRVQILWEACEKSTFPGPPLA